jgi:hypothetical protein
MKKCLGCQTPKLPEEFSLKRGKHRAKCKDCTKKNNATYYDKNRAKFSEYNRDYRLANHESGLEYQKRYREQNPAKAKQAHKAAELKAVDAGFCRRHRKELAIRRGRCILCVVKTNINSAINYAFNCIGAKRIWRTEAILGCDILYFKAHIERQFQDGMSWGNYGEWELDHIKPLALANTPLEIVQLNHYQNLQPLWAKENSNKSSIYNGIKVKRKTNG